MGGSRAHKADVHGVLVPGRRVDAAAVGAMGDAMSDAATPHPLAVATARREAAEAAEYAAWWAVERAHKRRAKPTEVAALEADLNEAKQRLVAACDLETRAREGR